MTTHSNIGGFLLLFGLGFVVLAALAGSVAWVWRDANRRGQPGFIVAVLVALLCWPVSLIVWVLARPNLPGSPAKPRTRGWVWALVAGIAIVLMVPLMALILWFFTRASALGNAREVAQRVACMSNQRQLAFAYSEYVQKHDGKCPRTFDDLREYGVTDKVLHCPAAADSSTPSYQLFCGTNVTDVIIRENSANHQGHGSVIAYGDGHVEWLPSGTPSSNNTNR